MEIQVTHLPLLSSMAMIRYSPQKHKSVLYDTAPSFAPLFHLMLARSLIGLLLVAVAIVLRLCCVLGFDS